MFRTSARARTCLRRFRAVGVARENCPVASDYERLSKELAASIKLGYEAEADDPNITFETPSDEEVRWLADWLVSEGWTRSPGWPRD
jgi:hypothetical protein